MRGSIDYQVQQIFYLSGIEQFGKSKHMAKELARTAGAKTWHEVGKQLGVYSYGTADAYREVWRQLLRFAKEVCRETDIEKLTGDHVGKFLHAVAWREVALSTYKQYVSALYKLEQALNLYSQKFSRGNIYDFKSEIEGAKECGKTLYGFSGSRAYHDPEAMIEAMRGDFYLAGRLQLESGARIDEIAQIKKEQLCGMVMAPTTGDLRGMFTIKGKGGKPGEKYVSRDVYLLLEENVDQNGMFKVDKDKYRSCIKSACKQTNQEYQGSHGLRWNYAQSRFASVQDIGELTYDQSLVQVSKDMGHNRADITEHYLK